MRPLTLTMRILFGRATVLGLLDEDEFINDFTLAAERDTKSRNDHYLAIFVFSAEPRGDGTLTLRILSTTVAGIQRYTTKRLLYQRIQPVLPERDSLLWEVLRAHYRAGHQDTMERLQSIGGAMPRRWTKNFANGAGDLSNPPEFVIDDPELAQLEELFSIPDPRPETGADDENF